ncbi:MAG: 30S ribosomal protein S16 [bacterium]
MVKIRLRRMGKHKSPFYRIVAIDSKRARDGAYIENLGHYDPFKKNLQLKRDRIEYWLSKGAKPTNTVAKLITKAKGGSL